MSSPIHESGSNTDDFEPIYRMLLSIDVNKPFAIDPDLDFYPSFSSTASDSLGHVFLWEHELTRCVNGSAAVAGGCVKLSLPDLDDSRRPLVAFDSHKWSCMHVAPRLTGGWVFLGELSKWVPVSSKRFSNIVPTAHGECCQCWVSTYLIFSPRWVVLRELWWLEQHSVSTYPNPIGNT